MTRLNSKVLFLDRDGVINVDHGYVHRQEDFEFLPGIFRLARLARANHYRIVVVTNQSGIGRGYYSEKDFEALSRWMCDRFLQEEAPIDHIFHCPFHPEATIKEYRQDHPWRKPEPGMLLAASEMLGADLGASVFIGDKHTDVLAGRSAGVGTVLLLGAPLLNDANGVQPTAVVENLADAAPWITPFSPA